MENEKKQMLAVFKEILNASLIENDAEKVLSFLADDVIGIGMGEQGFVSGKEDVKRIVEQNKSQQTQATVHIVYNHTEIRQYDRLFGTICAVLNIKTTAHGKTVQSALGQLMSFRKIDGRWRAYALQGTPLFTQMEEMEAYPIKFAEDVLEKYRQQEQLAKHANSDNAAVYLINFTKAVFENSIVKNKDLVSVKKDQPYEEVMFLSARTFLDEAAQYKFISTFSLGNILNAYRSGKTELSLEYQMYSPYKTPRWVKSVMKLYMDNSSQELKGCLYVVDIHEEKLREIELQSRAELDSMTGLYNKGHAEAQIAHKIQNLPNGESYAFLMIDLDFFKDINDTYGHQEGDRIIQATAKCILSMLRKEDIAGRLGGDEFGIYFHGDITSQLVECKAAYLCDQIRKLIPSENHGTSCSIGIVFSQKEHLTFKDAFSKADQALYRQKENGRDGYCFYQ